MKLRFLLSLVAFFALAVDGFATLSTDIVWEVRSAGADTNGGGYKTSAGTTDYSQQNSAQASASLGTSTASTTFTDVGALFTAAMVGNILHLNSGTGTTVGFYEITGYTNSTTITLDRVSGTYTAGVWSIGGAVATLGSIGSATVAAVAGNLICVKKDGTYSRGTNTDTLAFAGTSTNPIRICGYNATRPTVSTHPDTTIGTRTNGNGALVPNDMPLYTYTTGQLATSGNWVIIEALKITGAKNGILVDRLAAQVTTVNCIIENAAAGGSGQNFRSNAWGLLQNCDITLTNGGNAGLTAFSSNATGMMEGCRITSTADGMQISSGPFFVSKCTVFNCVNGINGTAAGSQVILDGNTIYGCSADNVKMTASAATLSVMINNMSTDSSGGYGFNLANANVGVWLGWNRTRDNSSGAINLGTGWAQASTFSHVTTDTGGASTDYNATGSSDFSLISASPAVNVGLPNYMSIGALQRSQTGGGAYSFSFSQ